MTEDFTTEALAFLLEELDPVRRAAFEDRLARDPVAAAAFKTCADSLADFALAEAPAAPPTAREREQSLAGVMTLPRPNGARPAARLPSWAAFWPAAAAVLLALNVGLTVLLLRGRHAGAGSSRRETAAASSSETMNFALHFAPPALTGAVDVSTPPRAIPGDPGREVKRELDRLAALRKEYARLRGRRDALNAEYQSIVRRIEDAALLDSGGSRIMAVQLVDGQSYAHGARNPSLDLSQPIMSEPGVIAAGPVSPTNGVRSPQSTVAPTGTTAATATTVATTGPVGESVAGPGAISLNVTGANLTAFPSTDSISGGVSLTPIVPPPAEAPASTAWSIYDEAAHQGYLDLYNLPTVTSDQALQLWVQPVGSSSFVPVGAIPEQYYGGSGSVYYKLPSDSITPGDILITVEPKSAAPTVPTGATVLRGP